MPDKLAVVGVGVIGEGVCDLAHAKGLDVTGVEIDASRRGELAGKPYVISANIDAVRGSRWVIVSVPTESPPSTVFDLKPLVAACEAIAAHLDAGTTVVIESTIPPRACEEVLLPVFRRWLDAPLLAHCPERMDAGRPIALSGIPRVLSGSTAQALEEAGVLYGKLLDRPPHVMSSVEVASMAKLVENAFRSLNIAFVNEVAVLCQNLGIDVTEVLEGANTKPFGFLMHSPGIGVGGPCLPIDLFDSLIKPGSKSRLLSMSREINAAMPQFAADILEDAALELGLPKGRVAILGSAYKPNVADDRNSPGLEVAQLLTLRGYETVLFDPYFPEGSQASSLSAALEGASITVLCTAHAAFQGIESELSRTGVKLVVDGRNALDRAKLESLGVAYRGIGRSPAPTNIRLRLESE